jgi:hypothetical protein
MAGPFCSQCGQRGALPIAVRPLLGALGQQLVGLDFRLARTVRELVVSPGTLLRGYLAGRRVPYTNPLKLLFLSATVYLLVVTLLDLQLTPQAQPQQQAATMVVALINYLVFLFLAPAAWWLRALFRRAGHNWAETYAAVCYLWSGYLLLAAVLGLLMAPVASYYFYARTALGAAYLVYGLRGFYRVGWWTAAWKGLLFYLGYFVATMLVMAVVVTGAYLTGFEPLMLGPPGR